MGHGDRSTLSLNGDQGSVQVFQSVGVDAQIALTQTGRGIQGDGRVLTSRFKLNDDVVGEAPKRGDCHPMREVLTALVNIVQNISQAVVVGPCHPCIPYLAHVGFDNGGEPSVHAHATG